MSESDRPPSRHSVSAWSTHNDKQRHVNSGGSTPVEKLSRDNSQRELVAVKTRKKSGALSKVARAVRGLWATRLTEDTANDPIKYAHTILRELAVYSVFLIIICIISLGMVNTTMYYYSKVLTELFIDSDFDDAGTTFRGMGSMEDFWNFAESTFLDGVYWEKWYNGKNITDDDLGFLIHENKLLGVPRFRMLKVKNDSCTITSQFQGVISQCYAPYSEGDEDRYPFGPWRNSPLTAWQYKTIEELGGSRHLGRLHYYGGGGFMQDVTTTRSKTAAILADMKQNRWLSRGTRAVFVDFTVYNANINLFCVIRLVVEFPATGGAIPQWEFRTVKLLRYVNVVDYFILALEGVFILFILYYTVEEILEVKKHKWSYFKSFWNILDTVMIILGYVTVAFQIYRTVSVSQTLEQLLNQPDKYADFEFLSFWQLQYNNILAIMAFLAWAKLFKYLSFNKTMNQLSTTLSSSAKDLGGFAVMFFIIFFAFAQMGFLIFGTLIQDFSSFLSSTYTLFRIILGDFDFHQLEQANRILGPTYFITYVFFVFFILLNMFLAIINDTYSEVKADMAARKNEFEITDYLKARAMALMMKIGNRKKNIEKVKDVLQNANANLDSKIDFDEWRADLKGKGFEDKEIDTMFKRYDADGDQALDVDEQQRMRSDLEDESRKLENDFKRTQKKLHDIDDIEDEIEEHPEPTRLLERADFEELEMRVENMERSIGGIVEKIDVVLVKLENMEKSKAKRREAMANILKIISEGEDTASDREQKETLESMVRAELKSWDKD